MASKNVTQIRTLNPQTLRIEGFFNSKKAKKAYIKMQILKKHEEGFLKDFQLMVALKNT